MEPVSWLTLILVIITITFLFDQVIDYLNLKAQRSEIPAEVEKFYDREKYLRSQAYHREQTRFSFITSTFSFLLSFCFLYFGWFGSIDGMLRAVVDSEILLVVLFFGVISLGSDLLSIPFQYYSVFVIEEKYGFNRMTVKTFIADKLKGYVIAGIIGGGLLAVLILLINRLGPDFWLYFWGIVALFMLLANMFYATLILPLFNKLTPLPEGELRDAIQRFAQKVNFPLTNIYVMDGSKRSKKANAFFSGIGKKKKIVLFDTLIANHTTDELVAVLAHEVGHFKKKHIVLSYFLSLLQVGVTLFVLSILIFNPDLSVALGANQWGIHLNLLAFTILFSPLSFLTGIFMNAFSRKNEFEADAYAGSTFNSQALSGALKKLSVDSLSNLYPHPAYVFIHYSHPPLLKRLEKLA